MARLGPDKLLDAEVRAVLGREDGLDLANNAVHRVAEGDAAVDENATFVGDGVVAGADAADAGHGNAALAKELVRAQRGVHLVDGVDHRQHLIDRVVAHVVAGGVCALAFADDLQLQTTLVAAVDVHLGRLADNHEVGADALPLDERRAADAVAPFLDVAQIVDGVAVQ